MPLGVDAGLVAVGDIVTRGIIQTCAAAGAHKLDRWGLVGHADEDSLARVRLVLPAGAKLRNPVTIRIVDVVLSETCE
jgi:hypothetical protein